MTPAFRGVALLRLAWLGLAWLILGVNPATAQVFSAGLYLEQCLRFEASGDLETARQHCRNALEIEPENPAALLALARLELALGNVGAAEMRLGQLRGRLTTAEASVLMAEVALEGERYAEAESHLRSARERLQGAGGSVSGRLDFVAGRLAQAQADYAAAVLRLRSAVQSDGHNFRYREALASLLFRLGDGAAARDELLAYEQLSGNTRNPALLSLAGRVAWGLGDLPEAAQRLEAAVALRGTGESNLQARDLQTLALVYYGQGDLRSGGLALREALGRGTLLMDLLNRGLPWVLGFILLLGLHLVAESRVPTSDLSAPPETPSLWSLTDLYSALLFSLFVALAGMLVYSVLVHRNTLAFVTPLQREDARAVYLALLALCLTVMAAWRVRSRGWSASEKLLGSSGDLSLALLAGTGLLALVIGYLYVAPRFLGEAWGGYYLDLFHLRPTVVAAALLVPLAGLFFSAFALPALLKRYRPPYAAAIGTLLFALVLVSPLPLLLVLGWVLTRLFLRSANGQTPVVAHLVVNVGLVLGVAFLPFVRTLFL
jgi:tetratricopeptide (TPR) repeat protein